MTKLSRLGSIWLAAVGISFFIVKVLRIGRVVHAVSLKRGWGIHSGDFLALIPLSIAFISTLAFRKSKAA